MNVRGFLAIPIRPDDLDNPQEWEPAGTPSFTRRYPMASKGPVVVIDIDVDIPDTALGPPAALLQVPDASVRVPATVDGEAAEEPEG